MFRRYERFSCERYYFIAASTIFSREKATLWRRESSPRKRNFFELRTQFPLREKHYSIRGGGLSCVRRRAGVCAVSGRRFIRSFLQVSFLDFWETSLFQRAFLVL